MTALPRWAALLVCMCHVASGEVSSTAGPRWFHQGELTPQANQLLAVLASASVYGLRAQDYPLQFTIAELRSITLSRATPALRARFDTALSQVTARFLMDLRFGRVDPQSVRFNLPTPRFRTTAEWALAELAQSTDVAAAVAAWEPQPPPYQWLKRALRNYRELAQLPKFSALPEFEARSLRSGDAYAGIPQLRTLLLAVGDLSAQDAAADPQQIHIDELLAAAVARFQARHGLAADGVIGKRTFAALTVPLAQRVQQLELTMERWRWIAALERPDIVVNVPQFKLYALPREDHRRGTILEMPVIVGRSYPHMRTPIFTANLREVVFHPFWDVPTGILHRELLPQIHKDPGYLNRHQMEIVLGGGDAAKALEVTPQTLRGLATGRYRLRQRPGRNNALGAIKFVMPNAYSVYLHSTPQQELFQRAQRAFSHGCIRVSDPAALAEYVLRNAPGDWNAAAIDSIFASGQTTRVSLTEALRVTVFYSTAAASESGHVAFYEDLYGHDRTLRAMLEKMRPVD